jgi:hypothetical protein
MAIDNKIIAGYLKDFKEDFEISENNDDIAFEKFANYCIISRIHPEAFTADIEKLDDLNIGGGEDTGIDGLAIIVNEHLVASIEEIEDLKKYHKRLDVRFIFIQSKTSPEFKAEKVATFIFGVKDFFREQPSIRYNENIKLLRELKDYIYENSIEMDTKPLCQLHYVTLGKWVSDTNVVGRATSEKAELERLDIFSSVDFIPVDADNLASIYRELKNKVTKEIQFDKHTAMPAISGVQEAYIGILPVKEYIKLISGSDGKMQRNLFYDNVRDFLGLNSVNSEIAKTVKDRAQQNKFAILNNGVTIVAKSIHKVGNAFKIKEFQIVNGCQTSHVLYLHKDLIEGSEAFIPVKLIITDDYEVANQITYATNRQSEVKVEAFASLDPYHRKLEEFYNSFPRDNRVYYERRARQYDNLIPKIPQAKIITLPAQINSFMAIFLNEPHSTHRYYGELLKAYQGKLFQEKHNPFMYYIGGYALYQLDSMFKSNPPKLDTSKRRLKYHVLLAFRIIKCGFRYPSFEGNEMTKYCEAIHQTLLNENNAKTAFSEAIDVVDIAVRNYQRKFGFSTRNLDRTKNFTYEVIEVAKERQPRYRK